MGKEQERSKEHDGYQIEAYWLAARFARQTEALRTYSQVQELIFRTREQCDLSAYRFLFERVSYVAVLGEPPAPAIDKQLQALLACGEPATLPHQIVSQLYARRSKANAHGPWVEGHYRPGRSL